MNSKLQPYFLLALLVGSSILVIGMLRPFLYPLLSAMIFAVACKPLYEKALRLMRGKESVAALTVVALVVVVVLAPLILLGIQVFQEALRLYYSLANGDHSFVFIKNAVEALRGFFPDIQDPSLDIDYYVKEGLGWILSNLGALFSSITKIMVGFLIFLPSLYLLLKNGHVLERTVIALSPLTDADDKIIFRKLGRAVNAVVKGSLLVALVQGVVATIGFLVFQLPHSILWGSVTAVAALVPGIGTALVIIPAVLFLFFTEHTAAAVGLLIWGFLAVGLIDNYLRPKFVGQNIQIHPFIIFLAVLGGVQFFGPMGVLLGPLAISLCAALFEIYSTIQKKANESR